ncbi:ATP dependent DNA helicase (DEAD box family) Rad3 [Legionella pneumophila]|uniref:hypothetical protein n=1 Tax=Legionella pneumophila TaxID=446 RepID=UPI000E059267|nr:hypothetical protein [Legionella pneumophila]STY12547.1 ATP dependent DNA helicase (DEAD box family) Rad3 [Legionella pneumophila]
MEYLVILKDELIQCLESKDAADIPGLKRCQERLLDLETVLLSFTEENNHKIRWLERFKHTLVFHATPYDVAESFSQLLKDQSCAYIFTSATLTMASAFDSFCKPLGLDKVQTLLLSSPFDYQQQALLYLLEEYPILKMLIIMKLCWKGFTSYRSMRWPLLFPFYQS